MKKSFLTIIYPVLFTLAMCFSACGSDDDDAEQSTKKYPGVGDSLPVFTVSMTNVVGDDLGTFTTGQLKRPLLLMFFHTTCPDCQRQLPVINQFYQEHKDIGDVDVVLVAREESFDDIAEFWRERSFTMPFSPQKDRRYYRLFAESGIPRVFCCRTDGIITATFTDKKFGTIELLNSEFQKYQNLE
jgi:thiol-disulfide isomerase/thioredoxin